jgi:ketosteroid isomerase-like protein
VLDRRQIEEMLQELYRTRISGQLDALCGLFSADAHFKIAGTGDDKPIEVIAEGKVEIRNWLSMMTKTFKISRHEILSMIIEGDKAAVHWRADIHSRVTGSVVATELVDLVAFQEARISSYTEFFVAC